MTQAQTSPALRLQSAELSLGGRHLWSGLNLEVQPGEFIAVLGPNGSGKTSLLRVLLGIIPLTSGLVEVAGQPPKRGSNHIGYVPQRQSFDPDLPLRGRDLVHLGLDGHQLGIAFEARATAKRVERAIRAVGAEAYADAPIGQLSGGEQQRLRIAQALVGEPRVLLCDEPLLSLDLSHQQAVSDLIDKQRRASNMAVMFITHEINPVLPMVDRILYLVGGKFAMGKPSEVLTSERLSQLYGTPIEVLNVHGRVIVVGSGDNMAEAGGHHVHNSRESRHD